MKNSMNDLEDLSARQQEVDRINRETQIYWDVVTQNPELSRWGMREMCQSIFDTNSIETHLHGLEHIDNNTGFIFAPNHPTVLDEHKILFENTHSLPYYIVYFDALVTEKTGKKVHFIVTDPVDPAYREVIENMEYIIVPHAENGSKMNPKDREQLNAKIQEYLAKGEHVAFFPEGNWYGTGNIGPLQKGLFHFMNQNPENPVIPVRMDGFDEPYSSLDITFGAPYRLDESPKNIETFVQSFRDRVFCDGLGLKAVDRR